MLSRSDSPNYKIINSYENYNHTACVIFVQYTKRTAIHVYKDITLSQLILNQYLSPKFEQAEVSPIAMFEPTARGWMLACKFAEDIDDD